MQRGAIDLQELSGGFDLQHTLESGQSYRWRRVTGEMYTDGSNSWYESAIGDTAVRVRQLDETIEWVATTNVEHDIRRWFRCHDDLESIYAQFPDHPLLLGAVRRYAGMRLVEDPPFPCLISFICSAQMRVERIYQMQRNLASTFGSPIQIGEDVVAPFPTPTALAETSEEHLRSLGLGYRAPYVLETAKMVADGEKPEYARNLPYEEAREYLTRYPGVGDKVADCVLLFSLGFLEAVPLDTWIRTAIEEIFPHCEQTSYQATSRAIREELGNEVAGYAQTYLFHELRSNPDWRDQLNTPA